ncbi:MAG: Gldg family protein [Clostridia bacterium]|nr:Gldg family protein [Clostridia bacterium]
MAGKFKDKLKDKFKDNAAGKAADSSVKNAPGAAPGRNAPDGKPRKGVKNLVSGRRFAKNTNLIVLVVVFVAVFVLLNLLAELIPGIDNTTGKLFTLTDISREVLGNLKEDVTIYALYDRVEGEAETGPGKRAEQVKILDLYDAYPRVTVRYVDLDRNPSFLASTVGETAQSGYSKGDFIVKCGSRIRHVTSKDIYATTTQTYSYFYQYEVTTGIQAETKFTSAILKVLGDTPVMCYSVGFGESSQANYSAILDYVSDSGYDVVSVDLRTDDIPENAAGMMFFGPTEDLTVAAMDTLKRWLGKGHSAYFFMDVKKVSDDGVIYERFDRFNEVFKDYGIALERNIVEETGENAMQSTGSDRIFKARTSMAGALENLPRTEIHIANTRGLEIENTGSTYEAEAFVSTSSDAKSISIDNETVRTGVSVVAASGKSYVGTAVSKICVFGSSQTFTDMILQFYGSASKQQMISASMKWMDLESQSNVADSIEAKEYNNGVKSAVIVTETQMRAIVIVTMIVVPALILVAGFIVWIRRRHL